MNRITTAACKLNGRHYFYEKNSISQSEKKCLAFRGSLQKLQDKLFRLQKYKKNCTSFRIDSYVRQRLWFRIDSLMRQ